MIRHGVRAGAVAVLLGCPGVEPASAQPLSVTSVTVPEPSGTSTSVATFTLRSTSAGTQTVMVSTAVPATGPAATPASAGSGCGGNADYRPLSNVSVTIPPNGLQAVSVTICGDLRDEDDEYFLLRVTQSNGTPVAIGEVRGTISDDDPLPSLQINNVTVDEGAAGTSRQATFTISLSEPSGRPVGFFYATAPSPSGVEATGGACGTGGADFVPVPPTAVTIPAGQPSTTRAVTICGDGIFERAEHVAVVVSNPTNATAEQVRGILSIADDEPPPDLALDQSVQFTTTGDLLHNQARFTVRRTGPPIQRPLPFSFATQNVTLTGGSTCGKTPSTSPGYLASSGTETFQPNEMTKLIRVAVCRAAARSGQSFRLRIASTPARVTVATATATVP